ncbi:DUF5615 family PIN-like protein [Anabaena sp. FACHB-1237]|uniref:DUF5615 family PIN-like protein n=1 Tax=Anabaena sp. FACHB-1237 TaxID=2692769 RepID=UPI00167FF776|nr:DUF5615 family PIN-like protein [Anabaena sp. FACHB-1237]MBD2139375.1 DUF5615 family PIN-like protein [Anabaena sp. FACHB-1237]
MARFYADEQFPFPVVEILRSLGHDVLTVQEAGKAEQRIPDDDHFGIVVCSNNRNWEQFAARINEAVNAEASLRRKLIRVVRPST